MLLTLLIVQAALWFHARQVAQAAVEQGARASRVYQGTDGAGVQATHDHFNRLDGPRVTEGPLTVSAGRGATSVSMTLETKAVRITPFLPAWPVTVTAGGPIEQFRPPPGGP